MRMGAIAVVPAGVALAVLAGCGGAAPASPATSAPAPAPAAPRLALSPCRDAAGFRCGRLTVPLHRRGPQVRDGRSLRLDVAVHAGRAARGDLVFLTGGPGQPARPFGPRLMTRLREALRGYRLVLLDQRGTGDHALRCDALQRAVGTSDLAVPPRGAVTACARGLGDRRDAYATADTVADLEALRAALGARRWTLAGISYGTLVAERYALEHPERVRRLVLDSVVPQEGVELLERVPMRATARVLRAVCAAGARCSADPADDLAAVVRARPALGPPLLDAVTALSIGVPQLHRVPALLHAARGGDVAPLRALLAGVRDAQAAPAGVLSQGLHAATLCADSPAPWGGPAAGEPQRAAAVAGVRRALRPRETAPFTAATALGQGLMLTCRWWPPAPAPPPAPAGPIRAPALLLNGDRDLSTPLEWARAQARQMPGARLVAVPGAGHSVLASAASDRGRVALRGFLQAPGG